MCVSAEPAASLVSTISAMRIGVVASAALTTVRFTPPSSHVEISEAEIQDGRARSRGRVDEELARPARCGGARL